MGKLDRYSCQSIDDADINSVVGVLRSDFLTQGPMVSEFEASMTDITKAAHACAVSSATAALHIGLAGLGVKKGDHVWTTPNTFVATVNAARYCEATVSLIDINQETYNLDLSTLERKLATTADPNLLPKVIIPVHFGGNPVDSERLSALATKYGFKILEDASHALGSANTKEIVGQCNFSDAAVFSFHPVKPLTSGEGGVITTNSADLHQNFCQLRSHGIVRDTQESPDGLPPELYYQQTQMGWNYRLSDIHAALGNSQLNKLTSTVAHRQQLRDRYLEELHSSSIQFQTIEEETLSSNHLMIAQFETCVQRNQVYKALKAAGIGSSFHYIPVYRHPIHSSLGNPEDFPIMEHYYATALTLPLHVKLSESDIIKAATIIKGALIL